ncbi:MAG: hypothetical protein H0T47_20885 [Planctomycetaceae bacterium]|nr:hypothetical protein [Planctomycetaceae bacterium]
MTAEPVVIDTGPLVALLDEDDPRHGDCQAVYAGLRRPVYTTWPVVTEAVWLLRKTRRGPQQALSLIESGVFVTVDLGPEAARWMRTFLDRYADLRRERTVNDILTLWLACSGWWVFLSDLRSVGCRSVRYSGGS